MKLSQYCGALLAVGLRLVWFSSAFQHHCQTKIVRSSIPFRGSSLVFPDNVFTACRGASRSSHVLSRRFVATCSMSAASSTGVESGGASGTGVSGGLKAVYKFLRPHTIRGTILASCTGVARALTELPSKSVFSWALLPNAVAGMLALLFGNAFIVGINQIYDVDIDKVNKPFLPVAAGELSNRAAWALVITSAVCGPLIVYHLFSKVIFWLYMFGTTVGGLYSVPPFRLKRFPVAAGLSIAICRGFLLNFGVYYAAREALGLSFVWNPAVAFLARFMTVYAGVIAVTKDLPDIEGDKKFEIETLSTRFGVSMIAKVATGLLLANYAGAVATALLAPPGTFHRAFMAGSHILAGTVLAVSARKLDPNSMDSIKAYYKRIWDLFYLEYCLYPFI